MRKLAVACVLAIALVFGACALPWKGDRTMKLPDQVMPAERHQVVPWLRCARFFTKDSGRGIRKKGAVAQYVRDIAANGGNAFRISVFWGGEALFQSNVAPHAPKLGDIDYIREALDEGNRLGVRIVTYMNPNCIYDDQALYPEVVIRKPDGSPWLAGAYGRKHNFYACINHPKYRKLLLETIAEIFTRYGPAGLYLDGLTPHVCFCPHCRARYRKMFGCDMPAKFQRRGPFCVLWEMTSVPQLIGDPADPDSYRLTRFLAQSLHDVTRDVTQTVKRIKPDAVVIYHSWPKPSTLKYYDATLNEIYVRRPWHHTLWKDGEFASFGAPFPLPMLHNVYLQHKTDCEARHKMIQALANGVYPNQWQFGGMKPIFEFVKAHERLYDFNAVEPVRHVALVRELHRSSVQRKIAGTADSAVHLAGPACWLRIAEREPRGKIDLLCLRADGRAPADAEWRTRRGKSTRDAVYLPSTSLDPQRSTTAKGKVSWEVGKGEGALSGGWIASQGHGMRETQATALLYKLPPLAEDGRDWALWARVLWPDVGSDSFYWAVSRDGGKTWQDTLGGKPMAAGWREAKKWTWVRAGVVPHAQASRAPHRFDRFLSPYVGAYSLLLHGRVPMATLHRRMIDERLLAYRVLFLANEEALSDEQLATITRFVRNGGGLVATGRTSLHDELGRQRRDLGLARLFGASYRGKLAYPDAQPEGDDIAATPWQLRFAASHDVTRGLGKARIPAVEDICRVEPQGAQVLAVVRGKGLPAAGVPAVLVHEYGKGRVVYLPNRIDSTFSRWLDPVSPRLIANAVEWACRGRVPCRVTSNDGRISVRLADRDDCRIVHLVNHTGDPIAKYTELPPVADLTIDLEVPKGRQVARVRALWSKQTLEHRAAHGRVRVRLPRLDEYEVIVAEWQ